MKKYKAAIIGCGWIGVGAQLDLLRSKPASHAEAIVHNSRLDLVALADNNPDALRAAEQLYPSVKRFSSIDEMFTFVKPEVIVIATHPDSHCKYIKLSAKARVKLILCEKPISHNLKESEEAIKVCEQNNVLLLVNHMRRFDTLIKTFKQYINQTYVKDTALGRVRSVIASYDNGLYHGGTHIVDLLRYFFGEVKAVSAVLNNKEPSTFGDLNIDAILQFEGFHAVLYFLNSKEYSHSELKIFGNEGIINLSNMWGVDIEIIGTKSCSDFSAYREPDLKNKRIFGGSRSFMVGTYEHIVDCLDGNDSPLCSGRDALETLRVLKFIERSVNKHGAMITL